MCKLVLSSPLFPISVLHVFVFVMLTAHLYAFDMR